ncbi:MAG: caspase family protein, partial [Okeania sp. SIO2F4]|uniref:caspase family protein n=1 Tax=Okeania sp. SIO2F4 TaxID=2607790 RepID=UPI00142C4EE5
MKKKALLVGVSKYDNFDNLDTTLKDVDAMKKILGNKEIGGFEIEVLNDSNSDKIEEAIERLFDRANENDTLLFYFSGHGFLTQEGHLYLATGETTKKQRGYSRRTSVASSFLKDEMSNSFSKRIIVILDCCFSGAFTQGQKGDEQEEKIDIKPELGGKGRAILMSSSSTQSSFESKDSELSIYTKHLVEGIRSGKADTDKDGKISVYELHQYASKKVKEESQRMTPLVSVEEDSPIYLAFLPQSNCRGEGQQTLPESSKIDSPSQIENTGLPEHKSHPIEPGEQLLKPPSKLLLVKNYIPSLLFLVTDRQSPRLHSRHLPLSLSSAVFCL